MRRAVVELSEHLTVCTRQLPVLFQMSAGPPYSDFRYVQLYDIIPPQAGNGSLAASLSIAATALPPYAGILSYNHKISHHLISEGSGS